jgi:predicted RNase H-like nuclease
VYISTVFDTGRSLANPVLGVDACKSGWVAIRLGESVTAHFAKTIDALPTNVSVIAIDIPIGLAENTHRQADLRTREFLRHRRSSLFMTPVRAAAEAPSHEIANAINQRLTGQGISIQAFGLCEKILQVDCWLPSASCPVIEVHPETSFAELAGEPLDERKKTWAGAERRRVLLAEAGIELSGTLGKAGIEAGVDDVLDAAVAAWTAHRYRAGAAVSLPDPPERIGDREVAIWR